MLVGNCGLGCPESPIRVLGSVYLHVCVHEGSQADGSVYSKPKRYHVLARFRHIWIFPRIGQAVRPDHFEYGTFRTIRKTPVPSNQLTIHCLDFMG